MWCASPAALAWGYSDVNVTIVVDEERLRGCACWLSRRLQRGVTSAKTPTYHAGRHPMSSSCDFGGPFDSADHRSLDTHRRDGRRHPRDAL